ncbi:hypothetical protein KBD45_04990 [Candidatus Dojkabacteria bacterium]|nr:hypothetical protein [Candidatus Dojkabacteria bacterium]
MIHKIPELLQKEIDKYSHLNIGGKEIVCPYFINSKLSSGSLRVMAGKGEAEEIELEVNIWAKVKGFDLENSSVEDIRKFMLKMHIGIDCSGFIANVLDNYLKIEYGKHLISYLKFSDNSLMQKLRRFFRPIENISANTLTSVLNCEKVDKLNDIKPGDLIRSKGKQDNAHHLALIVEVESEEGRVRRLKFVNSISGDFENNGIKYGNVNITNVDGELKDQNWPVEYGDKNYFYEGFLVENEDNGVRRLKSLKL